MSKKEILKEAKRLQRLAEYSFYSGDESDLLLDEEDDNNEQPQDETPNDQDELGGDMGNDLGGDMDSDMGGDMEMDSTPEDTNDGSIPVSDDEVVDDEEIDEIEDDEDLESDETDEVEIDVTDLTKANAEVKQDVNNLSQMLDAIIQKFNSFENQQQGLLSDIKKEIEKRNPTEVEKLEMRSLDSYPYNVKPTQYWNDVESKGRYQAKPDEEEEYVLTQQDVDSDFNPLSVYKSLSNKNNNNMNSIFGI